MKQAPPPLPTTPTLPMYYQIVSIAFDLSEETELADTELIKLHNVLQSIYQGTQWTADSQEEAIEQITDDAEYALASIILKQI